MKHIIAINASPRVNWNTATLVREAARGAEEQGAEVEVIDLYRLEKFTGCISCFGCKLEPNEGKCVCKDGLAPLLEKIRQADALILGTPNYLGDATAGFRALYERLYFQVLTYQKEQFLYPHRQIPVLFLMTSNAPEEMYEQGDYQKMVERYRQGLTAAVGPTKVYLCGNTLQVEDYSRFTWTMFDPQAKQERREKEFPREREEVFRLGAALAVGEWQ